MAHDHDLRWKELIRDHFAEFLQLADPELAGRLDMVPDGFDFHPTEVFAGGPRGRALRVDLAAAVCGREVPGEAFLIHVEVELRYRSRQSARFFLYNRLLAQRDGLPVSTLVLYLRGGPAGLRR